jgi:hypothetical protein
MHHSRAQASQYDRSLRPMKREGESNRCDRRSVLIIGSSFLQGKIACLQSEASGLVIASDESSRSR